jgi:hypothetical protein
MAPSAGLSRSLQDPQQAWDLVQVQRLQLLRFAVISCRRLMLGRMSMTLSIGWFRKQVPRLV